MTGNACLLMCVVLGSMALIAAGISAIEVGKRERQGWFAILGVAFVLLGLATTTCAIRLRNVADGVERWHLADKPDGSRGWELVSTEHRP